MVLLSSVAASGSEPELQSDNTGQEGRPGLQSLTKFLQQPEANGEGTVKVKSLYPPVYDDICYELCKIQMGGVACPCDIMPIG